MKVNNKQKKNLHSIQYKYKYPSLTKAIIKNKSLNKKTKVPNTKSIF